MCNIKGITCSMACACFLFALNVNAQDGLVDNKSAYPLELKSHYKSEFSFKPSTTIQNKGQKSGLSKNVLAKKFDKFKKRKPIDLSGPNVMVIDAIISSVDIKKLSN